MLHIESPRYLQEYNPKEALTIINDLQILWILYFTWSRAALIGRLFNIPTMIPAQNQLKNIPSDFYNVLRRFYEDGLSQQFQNYLIDRIDLEASIVNAMMSNDQDAVDLYSREYIKNAEAIAEFLGEFAFWDERQWKTYLYKDINLFFEEIRALITGDFEKEADVFRREIDNAMEMGRYMAAGIVRDIR